MTELDAKRREELFNIVDPTILETGIADFGMALVTYIDENGSECFGYRVVFTIEDPTVGAVIRVLQAIIDDIMNTAEGSDPDEDES